MKRYRTRLTKRFSDVTTGFGTKPMSLSPRTTLISNVDITACWVVAMSRSRTAASRAPMTLVAIVSVSRVAVKVNEAVRRGHDGENDLLQGDNRLWTPLQPSHCNGEPGGEFFHQFIRLPLSHLHDFSGDRGVLRAVS
jgi:hypothetical protein